MAKKALLGVLERTIGKFVKDLDAEKLNLGIWSGKVELHDLQLDVAACNAELDRQAAEAPNLAVPIQVVGGSFDRLELEIPWSHLTSKSVVMKASGLHIQVAPHDRMNETDFMRLQMASEAKRAEHIREARTLSLETADLSRLQTNELMKITAVEGDAETKKEQAGFVARLIKRIVENLQVDISNVQVSLEGPEGTAGICLDNFSFVTTDMAGHRTFVDRTNNDNPSDLLNKFLYKKLKLDGFAVFVEETASQKHDYVLDPLDFEAKFREADKSIVQEYPKYLLKGTMPSVQLGLSHRQYQQAMALAAAIAPSPDAAMTPLFPEYRPLRRISKDTAKDWWKYAYRCVGRMNGKRSWMEFMLAFRSRQKYVPLYKRHAHAKECSWMTALSKEELDTLKQIEEDRTISVDGIMTWRNIADAQVEKEKEKHNAKEGGKKKTGWRLFGGGKKANKGEDDMPISLSTEELKELEDVGLGELAFGEELSNDSKLCSVEFVLNELGIHMTNGADKAMMALKMGRVSTKFEADAGGSFEFGYQLQSLEILDQVLQDTSLFPSILRSLEASEAEAQQSDEAQVDAFRVHMSKSKTGDKKLTVKLVSFEAVAAPHLLTELVEFTKMPPANQEKLQGFRRSSWAGENKNDDDGRGGSAEETKDGSGDSSDYTESLSNALVDAWREKTKEKTSLTIDLDLQAPIIVLPESCTDPEASVLVFDFGGFRFQYGTIEPVDKVSNWLKDNPRPDESNNLSTRTTENQTGTTVVDHGRLEFKHLTYLVGNAESWKQSSVVKSQQEAIIEPITIQFDFAVESSVASSFPRVCTFAHMPASNFKLSPKHVSKMLRVYNAWMQTLDVIKDDVTGASNETSSDAIATPSDRATPKASTADQEGQRASNTTEVINIECDEVNKAVETSLGKEISLFTTMYLNITTETYSVVLYDSGECQAFDESDQSKANIAEGLVLAGALNFSVDLATDKTGGTTSVAAEVRMREFQIYSGFGRNLDRSLQILEPVTGALDVELISQGVKAKKIDVKARAQAPIDASFSMRNLTLINAITSEVTGSVSEGLKKPDNNLAEEPLDEDQQNEIQLLSSALENPEAMETAMKIENRGATPKNTTSTLRAESASSSIVLIDVRIPESKVTIINDLQGLDEALFRIKMEEFVTKSTIATMTDLNDGTLMETTYDVKLHTKFLADYFDSSVNLWKDLLQDPWEVSVKAERSPVKQSKSGRFSTKANIHSMPLNLAFSENFLIGIASANHMFTMSSELSEAGRSIEGSEEKPKAPRHLVSQLPYALDNCSGFDIEFVIAEGHGGKRDCPNGTMKYFRYLPPKGKGHGGKRVYGQDNLVDQSVKLFIGDSLIEVDCLDRAIGSPKRAHVLKSGTLILTNVAKEGRSTVLRVASNISILNRTPIPFRVSLSAEDEGVNCRPTSSLVEESKSKLVPYDVKEGTLSKPSPRKGFPTESLGKLREQWVKYGKVKLEMKIFPALDGPEKTEYSGSFALEVDLNSLQQADKHVIRSRYDVVCTPNDSSKEAFVFQTFVKFELIDGKKVAGVVSFQPRAQIVNTMPVTLTMLTKKQHIFNRSSFGEIQSKDTIHDLEPGEKMEVFSSGDELALKVRCSEKPVKGTPTGMSEEWIRVPLSSSSILPKPISSVLPFETGDSPTGLKGTEFFVAEASNKLPDFFLERINEKDGKKEAKAVKSPTGPKTYLVTVGNYGVDHTKSILFEQIVPKSKKKKSPSDEIYPFSTFISQNRRRISLLPTSEVPLRIVYPASQVTKKSAYFSVEEVSMSEGGAQATPLMWDDETPSGYYCYRRLVNAYQSELHIIPEFVVFNGSEKHPVTIKQANRPDISIQPGKTVPVFMASRERGLPLSFHFEGAGGATRTLQVEDLGLHIEMVRGDNGEPLGSVPIQTAIGSKDSRLVIRLGELGEIEKQRSGNPIESLPGVSPEDVLRCRIEADKVTLTLTEAIPSEEVNQDSVVSASRGNTRDKLSSLSAAAGDKSVKHVRSSLFHDTERPVCTLIANNFLMDFQRLFKEKDQLKDENDIPMRCQMSIIMSHFQIRDETQDSPFPEVFGYTGSSHFVDCCVRTKGPLFGRNVKIDLLDMILANSSGSSSERSKDKIILQTSESFVWKLIDTSAGILHASEHGADFHKATREDPNYSLSAFVPDYGADRDTVQHASPQVSTIYDIATAKVSPFTLVVSFKRRPQAERYESFVNTQGAHLMRYFTQQLKFTVDNCKLKFSRYEANDLRGPSDRLIEILTAVYVSRVKLKLIAILSAVSFADWKNLAARDDGDDEFVAGDVLRVTGTVAGNSVGYVFNKVGRGVNKSITKSFGLVGNGIENATALVGAREFGSSVNTVVAGIGGGVGGTLQGVGDGAGSILKGTGKGIGQFFGGIGGGGMQMAKGVGKGIVKGDGKAIVSGFKDGAKSMGSGVKGSASAVTSGVGSGFSSLTKGTAGGVRKSVKGRRESITKRKEGN